MPSRIASAIDAFNIKQGNISSLLILPLLAVVIFEVFMRYVMNAPTIWGFEATAFMYGVHYMMGCSYCDAQNGHVKVDIFSSMLPKKAQAVLNIITTLVLFMPVMVCMTIWSSRFALTSIRGMEVNSSSWAPPIWPFKILMAVAFLFLTLQGVGNLFRYIGDLTGSNDKA